jgi:hypothetical protein
MEQQAECAVAISSSGLVKPFVRSPCQSVCAVRVAMGGSSGGRELISAVVHATTGRPMAGREQNAGQPVPNGVPVRCARLEHRVGICLAEYQTGPAGVVARSGPGGG